MLIYKKGMENKMIIQDLRDEIVERVAKKDKIRKAINQHCLDVYGIVKYSEMIDEYFKWQDGFAICVCRQIPTINIEHLAKKLMAKWMTDNGLATKAIPPALLNDSFSGANALKCSLVSLPWLKRGKSGLFCERERILAKADRGNLDGRILADIQTADGRKLFQYHYDLRKKVLGEEEILDASTIFLKFLKMSIEARKCKAMQGIYIQDGLYEKKINLNDWRMEKITRPVADWYYLLHLMMYVDGSRAMLSTIGDNDKVLRWITEAKEKVKEITGFEPLMIDTPNQIKTDKYISEHLTEIPDWVFKDPNWRNKITMPEGSSSLFEACAHFESELILRA